MKSKIILILLLITNFSFASRTLPTLERMHYYEVELPRFADNVRVNGKPKKIRCFEIDKSGDTLYSYIKHIDSTQTSIKTFRYNRKNIIESIQIDCYDTSGHMLSTKTILPDSTILSEIDYLITDNTRKVKKIQKVPNNKVEKLLVFTEFDSLAEIITLDSDGKCSEKEIRIYDEMANIVRIVGFKNGCSDSSFLVELDYNNGKVIQDKDCYFDRQGRQHSYTFDFKYDSIGSIVERRFWYRNSKNYDIDKYFYDSLGRQTKVVWLGALGEVYESSDFQYEGTKQIRTVRSGRNKKVYTKIIDDTTTGYHSIEEYKTRNETLLYYRKVILKKDNNGNWVERRTSGYIKEIFGIKKYWESIKKREIEYW